MARGQQGGNGGTELGRFLRARRTQVSYAEPGTPDYDAIAALDRMAQEHALKHVESLSWLRSEA